MPRRREQFNPRVILGALERNRVEYVLIGGLAQVIRGADVTTTSVDICPAFAGDNLARLTRATEELDAEAVDARPAALTETTLSEHAVLSLETPAGLLRIVGAPEGAPIGFVDLRRAATKEHLGHGVEPLVASVGDLARLASSRRRDHDEERLPQLRRIIELEVAPKPMEPATEPTVRSTPRSTQRARRIRP